MTQLVSIPTIQGTVNQKILLEPLGGPKDVFYYLDRFPEEIYHKSPDTHLYKFMRSMLGESGVNWLRKNYLEARILLEEVGIELFDLDRFFGDPIGFGRIVEESFDEDPYGLISKEQWEVIKAKNARYRNRALDFINGARAGNTPMGMKLVAKAGLGHDVEIIENYKFLYDSHSDDPLGIEYHGRTTSTEEMIVLPRREVGQSEVQMISISASHNPPNTGHFSLVYNGRDTSKYSYRYDDGSGEQEFNTIPYDGTRDHVRLALESIPEIGPGNVFVEGGPGPNKPWLVYFQGRLANRDVPELKLGIENTLAHTSADPNNRISVRFTTLTGGRESTDEIVSIPARAQYHLQQAVDRIRPQTAIMTLGESAGLRTRNHWNQANASSEYTEVVRFVTGQSDVPWPVSKGTEPYWIESQVEKEAPRVRNDLQYHYTGFHNITLVEASSSQTQLDGMLGADRALADYAEPLMVTSATELRNGRNASFINGIYPVEYQDLPNVPPIRYKEDQYWSSVERDTDEWLIINFGFVKAVNYLSFDISRVSCQIDVEYDAYDDTAQLWVPVKPVEPYNNIMMPAADQAQNSWAAMGLSFGNRKGQLIYTRSLKIRLTRQQTYSGPIRIKNLRAARNVS